MAQFYTKRRPIPSIGSLGPKGENNKVPRFNRYQGATSSDYPGLRQVLAPQYRNLPAEDIEALFESYNLSAEDMEGFFDTPYALS